MHHLSMLEFQKFISEYQSLKGVFIIYSPRLNKKPCPDIRDEAFLIVPDPSSLEDAVMLYKPLLYLKVNALIY